VKKEIKKVTPLMKQYNKIKDKYPDALLLFRVGDFYETFHEDAVKTSKILGIVLTKRGAGSNSETKLAGFPHHSLNTYLHKLVKAGERVAICDQLEDPKTTKTIVKRGVTELITPGVSLNDGILEKKSNNFLASVYNNKENYGISFLDISTGELLISEGNIDYIKNLLESFNPKEILISKKNKKEFDSIFGNFNSIFYLEQWVYNKDFALEKIKSQFKILNLKGFGLSEDNLGVIACGSILFYLSETQHSQLSHITNINQIINKDFVWMDRFTMTNLELLRSTSKDGISLLTVIDYTSTPMGGRMLKRWIIHPILNLKELEFRHKTVDYFVKNNNDLDQICAILKSFSDLERIMAKVATSKISPRELIQLKNNLISIKPLKELLDSTSDNFVQKISKSLDLCEKLINVLEITLDEQAPVNVNKGNVVKKGFNLELDQLKDLSKSGKNYLNEIQKREIENTGISSLKISFNNVFGYYLEVRNVHKDKVPEAWIRKQTLVNAERYITQELKDYESKILGAEEKILALETQIFNDLILKLRPFISTIKTNSNSVSYFRLFMWFCIIS
jgi:DNA mismatch repair protein MutS